MSLGLMRPCLTCGDLTTQVRCAAHERERERSREDRRGSYRERGYDAAWDRLSKRARARQNFCSRCGSTENLSVDHKPEAWARKAAGLPISLRHVDVLCARCQSIVGSSRPGSPRYVAWEASRG